MEIIKLLEKIAIVVSNDFNNILASEDCDDSLRERTLYITIYFSEKFKCYKISVTNILFSETEDIYNNLIFLSFT